MKVQKDTSMSRDIQGTVMFKFATIVSGTFDCSEKERNTDMNRNGGWGGDGINSPQPLYGVNYPREDR